MPIQAAAAADEIAELEVYPEYEAGLKGIDGFDYLILITHLHLAVREQLQVVPFMDDKAHGIFATRAPARPNRLGLSVVKLIAVKGRILQFSGNDMLDLTPVLDIKPYVPRFDVRDTSRIGWYAAQLGKLSQTMSDNRMV